VGGVHALTDATQAVAQSLEYSPYGRILVESGSAPNNFGFPGTYLLLPNVKHQPLSPTRLYDAKAGRYTGKDPRALAPEFGALMASPQGRLDPSGRSNGEGALWWEWRRRNRVWREEDQAGAGEAPPPKPMQWWLDRYYDEQSQSLHEEFLAWYAEDIRRLPPQYRWVVPPLRVVAAGERYYQGALLEELLRPYWRRFLAEKRVSAQLEAIRARLSRERPDCTYVKLSEIQRKPGWAKFGVGCFMIGTAVVMGAVCWFGVPTPGPEDALPLYGLEVAIGLTSWAGPGILAWFGGRLVVEGAWGQRRLVSKTIKATDFKVIPGLAHPAVRVQIGVVDSPDDPPRKVKKWETIKDFAKGFGPGD